MSRSIVPIVEGHGEVYALPILMRKILAERLNRYDLRIARPINAKGKDTLRSRIDGFVSLTLNDDAALVLFDADEDCALELVRDICASCNGMNARIPIAVVCAVREYESWFLASFESVVDGGAGFPGDPDAVPNPKDSLRRAMPDGRYRETVHQAALSARIDLDAASANSRSFRRLCHAVEELASAIDSGTAIVTPEIS